MPKQRSNTFCIRVSPDLGRMLKELAVDQGVPISVLAGKYLSDIVRKDVRKLRERQAKEVK